MIIQTLRNIVAYIASSFRSIINRVYFNLLYPSLDFSSIEIPKITPPAFSTIPSVTQELKRQELLRLEDTLNILNSLPPSLLGIPSGLAYFYYSAIKGEIGVAKQSIKRFINGEASFNTLPNLEKYYLLIAIQQIKKGKLINLDLSPVQEEKIEKAVRDTKIGYINAYNPQIGRGLCPLVEIIAEYVHVSLKDMIFFHREQCFKEKDIPTDLSDPAVSLVGPRGYANRSCIIL